MSNSHLAVGGAALAAGAALPPRAAAPDLAAAATAPPLPGVPLPRPAAFPAAPASDGPGAPADLLAVSLAALAF